MTAEGTAYRELTPGTEPDPGDEVAGAEIGRVIAAAVTRLPPDQRDVFLLRTQAGLTFAEIARLRHVPLNTALGRMHYAVLRLRQELGGMYTILRGR